ncbi:TIM-barrel domain-containing protein [Fodinibius salsisoli]|uniref:Glycoside hydrolase family 31 TIM barrel domain-containing protein n=1 Tax=Fodinibius salsisoli TaxID=2820877 RepID=A0ABT3PIG3_9BACT|nr:TIM-barrel domain-containing protein [Fodinibius salsisoli]MCW9705723.1 hypothetical protein [Fodinibius salsisoli]
MPRAGYTKTRQYATPWGGDHYRTWLGFRNAVIGMQRSAIMGFPFWGSDTGGYQDPTDRHVLARWLGFSAFTPMMEVGPISDRAPWDMLGEPHYDTELIAIYRLYSKLKMHMLDYTYELATKAHKMELLLQAHYFLNFRKMKKHGVSGINTCMVKIF